MYSYSGRPNFYYNVTVWCPLLVKFILKMKLYRAQRFVADLITEAPPSTITKALETRLKLKP